MSSRQQAACADGSQIVGVDGLADHPINLQCPAADLRESSITNVIAYFRVLLDWDERLRIESRDGEAA
jgi:hypothetical protein